MSRDHLAEPPFTLPFAIEVEGARVVCHVHVIDANPIDIVKQMAKPLARPMWGGPGRIVRIVDAEGGLVDVYDGEWLSDFLDQQLGLNQTYE